HTLTVPSGLVLRATGTVTINGTIKVLPPSVGVTPPFGLGQLQASQLLHPTPAVGGLGGTNAIGSQGGQGGGSFAIFAGNITIGSTGLIAANGTGAVTPMPPSNENFSGSGGGGGGVIVLLAQGTLFVDPQ